MKFLLTIVLYIIVIITIAFLLVKANPNSSDNEDEPLISRKNSGKRDSLERKGRRRSSHSSYKRLEHNSHNTGSVRRSSISYVHCGFRIQSYLRGRKIFSSIYETVWHSFHHRHYWKNNFEDYKLKIIEHINLIRLKYGACPLQENEHLNELAQTFANKMAKHLYFDSKPFKGYGIIHSALTFPDLTKVVSNWYSGRRFYSYSLSYKIPMAKEFTQMVWKSSSLIGVGVGRRARYFYIAVFIYPKGNIKDHFKTNVLEKEISWKKLAQIS